MNRGGKWKLFQTVLTSFFKKVKLQTRKTVVCEMEKIKEELGLALEAAQTYLDSRGRFTKCIIGWSTFTS